MLGKQFSKSLFCNPENFQGKVNSRALKLNSGEQDFSTCRGLPSTVAPGRKPGPTRRHWTGFFPEQGGPRGCWPGSCLQLHHLAATLPFLLPDTTCSHLKAHMRPCGIWHCTSMASTTPLPHWAVLQGPAEWAETDPLHVHKHPATTCTSNCFSIHASRYCCYLKLVCRNKQNWAKTQHCCGSAPCTGCLQEVAAVLSLSMQPHPARHRQLDAPGSGSHMPGFHLTCSEDSRPSPLHVPLQNRASHSHVLAHRAQEPSAAYAHSTAGSRTTGSSGLPPAAPSWNARTSEMLDNTWLLYLGVIQA